MENLVDVYPRIVPAGQPVEMNMELKGLASRLPLSELEFTLREESCLSGSRSPAILRPSPRGENKLCFSHSFPGEQQHVLRVSHVSQSGARTDVARICLYSLEADLFSRSPFKGDFHIHSIRSDGREPPAYVAAACRRIGLDFMALTDHFAYEPSLEAIEAFRNAPMDLRMFPGEEVHPPGINQHVVNFGGSRSVNAMARDKERFEKEVMAIEAELPASLDARIRHEYAGCLWVYRKIREAGGIGVFCHPYWIAGDMDHTADAVAEMHFHNMPFDAYELIGGFSLREVESNIRQVSRYHEDRILGRKFPIVGASDAHGCERGELFGWYYTIVFAHGLSLGDLKESLLSLNSVAIEALPGQTPRAHGPYRLVRYAQFLMREFFPLHDELCLREGLWMFAYLAGDERAAGQLAAMKGQTARLADRFRGTSVPVAP